MRWMQEFFLVKGTAKGTDYQMALYYYVKLTFKFKFIFYILLVSNPLSD